MNRVLAEILGKRSTLEVVSAVTLFKKGDVLFGKLRPYLEKFYEAEFDGKCTGEILAFRPFKVKSRFLLYCFASRWFIEYCNALAYGAKMPRVSWPTQLAQFNIPLPPPKEQQLIADYLDTSCAVIDAAIEQKSKQIISLKAIQAAWIHQIFNNESWPQERIKDVSLKIGSGVTPDGGAANYLDQGIPLIRSQNVTFEGLQLDDVAFISEDTHKLMFSSQLKPCDVLLNITGASIGRCTYVPEIFGEANVNQHVCIIRGDHKINHRFLAAFLQSPMGQSQVFSSFTGASRQGLSHKDLGLMKIPLPKIEIQMKAVEEFDSQLFSHKRIQGCIESQISTLLAYRKSLIHECVTGQRRVSEADVKKVQAHGR